MPGTGVTIMPGAGLIVMPGQDECELSLQHVSKCGEGGRENDGGKVRLELSTVQWWHKGAAL
jgi:hypothetical protein